MENNSTENNRPKQILDSTFRHLDEVLEETKKVKRKKENKEKSTKPEGNRGKRKKN